MQQVKLENPEPIKWVKIQLTDGANIFLRNTNVLNMSLMLYKLMNMLGLKYYLFNGNVDMRMGMFRLCEYIRTELSMDPSDATCVYGEESQGGQDAALWTWFLCSL